MKTIILKTTTTLLILAGVFFSCENKENPLVELFLTVDETSVTATAEAGTYTIAVNSNGKWTAVVEDVETRMWCILTTSTDTITVNIAENTDTSARNAVVKIITGDLVKRVQFSQEAACFEKSCWDYPIKPDMPEWTEFKSLNEKVAACQIPDSILSRLSTECLTKVCLQYPLLYDIFAFSSYPAGFDRIFYEFNGIRELFEKEKAPVELLKHYNGKILDMSILDNSTTPNLEKGYFIMSISALEVLLYGYSQKVDAARESYIEILRCLTVGYEKKLEYTDYFKGSGFASNFFARANIIVKINPESIYMIPTEILDGNPLITQDFAGIINELSYQLIQ